MLLEKHFSETIKCRKKELFVEENILLYTILLLTERQLNIQLKSNTSKILNPEWSKIKSISM